MALFSQNTVQWLVMIFLGVSQLWIHLKLNQVNQQKIQELKLFSYTGTSTTEPRRNKRFLKPLHEVIKPSEKVKTIEEYCLSAKEYCPDGVPGPIGPPGQTGYKGTKGEKGAQGMIGVRGYPGPQGEKGDRGIDGRDGLPGEPGLDGVNGRIGIDGRPGRDGVDGIPGKNGRDGVDGKDGLPGPPGLTGSPGDKGLPGMRGYPGEKGTSGQDGTPGIFALNVTDGQRSEILQTVSFVDAQFEKTLEAEEGMSLSVNCSAHGFPKPSFSWQRTDDKPILMNGAHYVFGHGEEVLTFSPLLREHFGEYECSVNNGLLKPLHRKINIQVTFRPEIVVPNALVKATNGSDAIFDCIVEAFPQFTYEWQFRGRLLNNETQGPSSYFGAGAAGPPIDPSTRKYTLYSISFGAYQTNLRLVVHRLDPHDYGVYQLRVRNLINVTTASMELVHVHGQHQVIDESTWRSFGVRNVSACNCQLCSNCTAYEPCTPCRPQKCEGYHYVKIHPLPDYPNNQQVPMQRSQACLKDGKIRKRLLKVGIPLYYTEFETSFFGCWLKDGAPADEVVAAKVWLTRETKADLLLEYANVEALRNRRAHLTFTLKRRFSGNAQAIYAGFFYYNQEGGNWLVKYRLNNRNEHTPDQLIQLYPIGQTTTVAQIVNSPVYRLDSFKDLPKSDSAHSNKDTHKQSAMAMPEESTAIQSSNNSSMVSRSNQTVLRLYKTGHNLMDILTDEHGLWVIYAWPQTNDTVVLKMDANQEGTPRIENAFEVTLQRDYFGQAFIACGVLYLIDSVRETRTKIELAIDLFNQTKVPLFDSDDELLDDLSLAEGYESITTTPAQQLEAPLSLAPANLNAQDAAKMTQTLLTDQDVTVPSARIMTSGSKPIKPNQINQTNSRKMPSPKNETMTRLKEKLDQLAKKLKMKREGIEFINPFKFNKQVSYNPVSKKVYAWDGNALIEYALLFNF